MIHSVIFYKNYYFWRQGITFVKMSTDNTTNSDIFKLLGQFNHQKIVFCNDDKIGLKAIITIHDTTLGPAIGGTRILEYKTEQDAIKDSLRLSKAMTYKSAITGVNLGGGNAVIIGNNSTIKTEALLRRFGQFVNQLNGSYITSLDIGTTPRDMEIIKMETPHVAGLPNSVGGSGDSSPFTAKSVYYGIKAGIRELFGNDSLAGRTILVQGTGQVGADLVSLLRNENAKVYVSDIVVDRMVHVANRYGAEIIQANNIYNMDVDVYAPCALGGTLNDDTIPKLKCKIIAGSANNQLKDEDRNGKMLLERGILYAPDYLINAGGLISCYSELAGYSSSRTLELAENIYEATRSVIRRSKQEQISAHQAANKIAEDRINSIKNINNHRIL